MDSGGPRRLAAFVFAFAMVAEFAGCGPGLHAAAAVVVLATLVVFAPTVLAPWSPWLSRTRADKRWAELAGLVATVRAELATLQADWHPPNLGAIWDQLSFREARRLLAIQKKRKLVADDIPPIASGQARWEIHSRFKYDVNEHLFLLRAILRTVWSSLVPLYIADALVQAMDMFDILLDGYILHCLDVAAEHKWYQGHIAALLLVLLKVSRSRIDGALEQIATGWTNVGDALTIEFNRLQLTNTGLRKAGGGRSATAVISLLADMRQIQSVFINVAIIATTAWSVFGQVGWLAAVPLVVPMAIGLLGTGFAALTGNRFQWNASRFHESSIDSRVRGISRSIRTVKLFGWERLYVDPSLQTDRRSTIALPWYAPAIRTAWFAIDSIEYAASQISAGLLVYTYAHTTRGTGARPITNADLFRVSGLIEHLRSQVDQFVGRVRNVQQLVRRYNAIERFLRGDFVATLPHTPTPAAGRTSSVAMDGCSFTWSRKPSAEPVLRDISLVADAGELVAVVGKTGAGKSSLLLAACSELEMTSGTGAVAGSVAYLEQAPWIMNSSLRENIVFGRAFDQPLYDKVIHACAFVDDLAAWPDGDRTIIGDRGINISGGQRARLALARTLYMQADIYVLDDPLSAVDAHVKRHILEHVILDSGLLAGKLRIIATHTKHIVPFAHQIVTLDGGRATVAHQTPQTFRAAAADPPLDACDAAPPPTPTADDDKGYDDDDDNNSNKSAPGSGGDELKKWSLRENLGYIVRICGLPAIAMVMLTGLIDPVTSFIMDGYVLDALRADSDSVGGDVAGMLRYISLTMASDVVWRIVRQTRYYVDSKVINKYLRQRLRGIFVNSLVSAPLSLFDSTTQDQISSAYDDGVGQVSSNIVTLLLHNFGSATRTALSLYRIGCTSPALLLALPPIAWINIAWDSMINPVMESLYDVQYSMMSEDDGVQDALSSGSRLIRLFGVESHFLRRQMDRDDENKRVAAARESMYTLNRASYNFVSQFSKALVVSTMMLQAQRRSSKLSSGEYLCFQLLVDTLIDNMNELIAIPGQTRTLAHNINVFRRFAAMDPECPVTADSVTPPADWPPRGMIEFRDFGMRYHKDASPALSNVSLTIHPGERVGIVGRTGAGKSSLIKALFRLHPHNTSGAILIDGQDISALSVGDLRPRLGIIPQESTLIPGSLRENLDPLAEFTVEDVWAALIRCSIASLVARKRKARSSTRAGDDDSDGSDGDDDDDDESNYYSRRNVRARKRDWAQAGIVRRIVLYMLGDMPDPHDYYQAAQELAVLDQDMGHRSASLSSGQQQLFSLCRLIMRQRRIVVLDEATADLDMETDREMHRLINEELRGCTILTIAHRLETVMNSDRIVVMDKGEVVEAGPPQELKERGGLFARLVRDDDFGQ
ncbi:Multidrug resistance-associated protein 1 [Coemansia spiralis]|nr:Multidrug resistance-associated protein 1 [Coemansia spiralis]